MRRNRTDDWIRSLVSENTLSVRDLIWPIFVSSNQHSTEIKNMPGVKRSRICICFIEDDIGLGIYRGR